MRARGAYNATKFALEGLTDTMRQEIAGTNIDLILVQPGLFGHAFGKMPISSSKNGYPGKIPAIRIFMPKA